MCNFNYTAQFKYIGIRDYLYTNPSHTQSLPNRDHSALTSRVYIWDKTIESVKERPLFGYGMDTLLYFFPHKNIDARAGIYNEQQIVSKAHSLYFSFLHGVGVIGLIFFLGIMVTVLTKTIMHLFRTSDHFNPILF